MNIGTLAWARESGGRLSRKNELRLLLEAGLVRLKAHPRLQMKSNFVTAMKQQSNVRPRSRAGFLCMHGFISMIRHAPFEDSPAAL